MSSAVALVAIAVPGQAIGQDIASRVAAAPDGWVRFTYEAREGVCGNGQWISFEDGQDRRGDGEWVCEEGPVRIELRVRGGAVRDLENEVAGEWAERSGDVTDLGEVAPAAAVAFLFELVETARDGVAKDAIFPATIARGVETWPRLLEIARNDARDRAIREQAIFWLSQEASERATEGLTSIIEDEGELSVREHAIFALSQRSEPNAFEALMRLARSSPEPELRSKAIFWLGQRGDDPRVLSLLEEILTSGG